jgi:carbon-monoxide dehydrogenase medium subunit
VIPTAFDYQRAASLDDAVAKLAASNGNAKLIGGGHSLIPLMKFRMTEPLVLIDIARIPDLRGIRERDGKIEIGAATVHHDVATSPVLRQHCPVVSDAAAEIGDPQVRNRGTLGGSLAHADPSADYPPVMLAIDADIHIKGPKGWRVAKARDFFKDLFTVDLAPDEIISGAQFVPIRTAAYAKLHQRASHYAIIGVAAAGSHAIRLTNVEEALAGQPASAETIGAVAKIAGTDLQTVNADIHASEEYRRAMIPVFTRRALEKAIARA